MEQQKGNQISHKIIILSVQGGAVQDVFCADPDLRVILINWDTPEGNDPDAPGIVEIRTEVDRPECAYVAEFSVSPFSDLPGTDVLKALQAAYEDLPECQSLGTPCRGTTDAEDQQPSYSLNLDGPRFRDQRALLLKLLARTGRLGPPTSLPNEKELLEGLIDLTDVIADQACDCYGLDCQFDETDQRCECELPGHFCSGVPGILARLENNRLAPDSKVERCDLCQRYPSDEAAHEKLRELDLGRP